MNARWPPRRSCGGRAAAVGGRGGRAPDSAADRSAGPPPRGEAMVMSLQEISDRLEIQELLVRYSHSVDTRDWDAYENVFTPDAFIDYTCFGGPSGNVKEIRAFLEMAMPNF